MTTTTTLVTCRAASLASLSEPKLAIKRSNICQPIFRDNDNFSSTSNATWLRVRGSGIHTHRDRMAAPAKLQNPRLYLSSRPVNRRLTRVRQPDAAARPLRRVDPNVEAAVLRLPADAEPSQRRLVPALRARQPRRMRSQSPRLALRRGHLQAEHVEGERGRGPGAPSVRVTGVGRVVVVALV